MATDISDAVLDEASIRDGLDTRLTDADGWQTETDVYQLDGEVSAFPPRWHEDLTGERDVLRYAATMTVTVDGGSEGYAHGGHGDGIPEKLLLDTAVTFGDYEYSEASEEVDRCRREALLTADADQHPTSRVQLTPAGAEHLGIDPEAEDVDVKTGTDHTKDPRIDE